MDENAVVDLVEGRVGEAKAREIASHLDECPACRELVAEAVSSSAQAPRPQAVLARGTAVGRYVIDELVGAGAMGVVYAARDPVLSRRVALKLLRSDAADAIPSEQLLREAQALARLAHPHVIAIYDAGAIGEQRFLAMELVEGQTLTEWLRERPRRSDEILAAFCDAGEGLAAAHAVGLVHRDFKPDNVLVGADGRVRVTDFGLAREQRAHGTIELSLPPRQARTTALAGTPAYMAPEQRRGEPADAKSDQFSFCVALHEALFGALPPEAHELAAARGAVERTEAVRKPRIPAHVRRAIAEGLRPIPAERHASMDALLRALRRSPRITPVRVAFACGAILLAGFALRSARPTCTGADAAWGDLWSNAQESTARAAFRAASGVASELPFSQIDRALQSLRASWIAMHNEACLSARARGEQSEVLLDRRMQCLDDRRREAQTLAELFTHATPPLVEHAKIAVDALTPLSRCADARALLSPSALPEAAEARAAALEAKSFGAQAKSLIDAGDSVAAIPLADKSIESARRSGHKPTLAMALFRRADAQRRTHSDPDKCVRWLHESATAAEEGQDDGAAADAFILLSFMRGYLRGDYGEGELWASYAAAAIARMGGDDLREAARSDRLAALYMNDEARADVARAHSKRAIDLYLRAGASDYIVMSARSNLAAIELNAGNVDAAVALFREVSAAKERINGPDSPANGWENLGSALTDAGRASEAIPILRRQWEIEERRHNLNYFTEHKLATALRKTGQLEEALRRHLDAVRMYEEQSGHVDTGWAGELCTGLGEDLLALQRPAEAVAPLERALRVLDTGGGELAALARFALARALWDARGDRKRAVVLATQALEVFRGLDERHGSYYRTERLAAEEWLSAHQGAQAQAQLAPHQAQ